MTARPRAFIAALQMSLDGYIQGADGEIDWVDSWGREATEGEIDYARWTQKAPHYVLSTTLDTVNWETAHLVRDIGELRELKDQPGGPVYVIGGAALVSSLLNAGLIDELRLIVHPIILGGGKAPFAGVNDRRTFELTQSRAGQSDRVVLGYRI
jgi:dihydrofolate reductase